MEKDKFTVKMMSGHARVLFQAPYDDVYKIRVNKLQYRIEQYGVNVLLVRLNDNCKYKYYDGYGIKYYDLILFNDGNKDALFYCNTTDNFDIVYTNGRCIMEFSVTIDDENTTHGTPYITEDNPLYLEIEIHYKNKFVAHIINDCVLPENETTISI